MWDIKKEDDLRGKFDDLAFIWTMWDIKPLFLFFFMNKRHFFHLNHVGYKARWLGRKRATWRTFIWTMWDIKLFGQDDDRKRGGIFHLNHVGYKGSIRTKKTITLILFHLNHVGYKVRNLTSITHRSKTTFIWTMWDIKSRNFSILTFEFWLSSEPCGI